MTECMAFDDPLEQKLHSIGKERRLAPSPLTVTKDSN
jgi:hypothetical protein